MIGHGDWNVVYFHPANGEASNHGREMFESQEIKLVKGQEEVLRSKLH